MLQVGPIGEGHNQAHIENKSLCCHSRRDMCMQSDGVIFRVTVPCPAGGADSCCTARILNAGSSCDDVDSAPCFIQGKPVSAWSIDGNVLQTLYTRIAFVVLE